LLNLLTHAAKLVGRDLEFELDLVHDRDFEAEAQSKRPHAPNGQQSVRIDTCLSYAGAQEGGAARVLPCQFKGGFRHKKRHA
jgi:hypothetical protein